VYVKQHQPLVRAHEQLLQRFNDRAAERQKLEQELHQVGNERASFATQNEQLKQQLEKTAAEKEAALAELRRTKDRLSTQLEQEIAAGNVWIQQRGNDLVVDVADKILFPKGEAEMSDRGRAVLAQVAETLAPLDSYRVQVGGHTDDMPIKSASVRERYPTNWELSAARATHVVRFLQEDGKIAGDRLLATGFAEFRPTASNKTPAGRQRNRRIEIVLLPKP
jgi:chemotaxis protein MotB